MDPIDQRTQPIDDGAEERRNDDKASSNTAAVPKMQPQQKTGDDEPQRSRPATIRRVVGESPLSHACPVSQPMALSAAATANPNTVTRPAMSPALRTASGIMLSTNITRRAPAAKPSMPA
jgi:hypothetical protein